MPKGIYVRTNYHIPWNKGTKGIMKGNSGSFKKGNKLSEEIREKMSKSRMGHIVSKETRIRISLGHMGKKHTEITKEKLRKLHIKNGFYKINGYIYIYKPKHPFCNSKSYIFEHRLVVEKQIGRYLLLTEPCHHLGKRDDNRPHMLMAFVNHSSHIRFHKNPNNVKPSEIIFDGRLLA